MDDGTCVTFLQWALPPLRLRWAGFRKVRGGVCKRIARRLRELQLPDAAAYRDYLQRHPAEWATLDALCRVTISRFHRDRALFSALQSVLLPELIERMRSRGEAVIRVWSAGCAAGEEPYGLSILWELELKKGLGDGPPRLEIIATDSDASSLDRAVRACYPCGSIKGVPEGWRSHAFAAHDGEYCLHARFRRNVDFIRQDLRAECPAGRFDLILCRNLAFTYFDEALQGEVLQRLADVLRPGGMLVVGIHETLPQDHDGFESWSPRLGVYRRRSG